MAVSTAYGQGPGGYYLRADGSGPYAVDGNGIATLINSVAVAGNPALPAGTDRSSSITAGGTAQSLAAANSARVSLKGQNTSSGDLWINEIGGTAAVSGAGSFKVPSGAAFSISTNRAISVIGATTGQTWAATET